MWPFAHAWAVDDPTIEADAAGDSPGADQHQQQQQQQRQRGGDATNPWRTVALVLGAMLVAALVHPPLASASSTLIAAVAANVVAPVGVLYPAATYIAAGAQAWANNAVGVVGTLVSSAASAGAGYAAASARARAEMEELRAEIAVIREAAAAVGISAVRAVVNPAVVISASEPRPAIAEETRGAVVPTEDPVVAAERASAEAELADLRRQLARLRAVWTPNDDDDDEGDDAGERGVGGGAPPPGTRRGSRNATGAMGRRGRRPPRRLRGRWMPERRAATWTGARRRSRARAVVALGRRRRRRRRRRRGGGVLPGIGRILLLPVFHSSTAIDEEEAARISAEIVALRAELAGVRGVGGVNSRMTVPVPGAPGSPGDLGRRRVRSSGGVRSRRLGGAGQVPRAVVPLGRRRRRRRRRCGRGGGAGGVEGVRRRRIRRDGGAREAPRGGCRVAQASRDDGERAGRPALGALSSRSPIGSWRISLHSRRCVKNLSPVLTGRTGTSGSPAALGKFQ